MTRMTWTVPLLAVVALGSSQPPARPGPPVIVLDPGHGGDNPGAVHTGGTKEKTITLALARRIAALLEESVGARVVLTREWDHHVGLPERARLANELGADGLLSLHCNSSPAPGPSGFEAIYLAADGATQARHLDAARAWAPAGVTGAAASIVADLVSGTARLGGARLAGTVHDVVLETTGAEDRGLKEGAYTVLVAASVPATVLEVGFLNHPEEGEALLEAAYQDELAGGIARGVEDYLRRSGRID